MTPFELEVLVRVYCYESVASTPESRADQEAARSLERAGLIERRPTEEHPADWYCTSRGRAHVAQLCRLPFPEPAPAWQDADGNLIAPL